MTRLAKGDITTNICVSKNVGIGTYIGALTVDEAR